MRGRACALLFDQPSTRTRVSFQVAIAELGGTAIVARWDELQAAENESLRDTAWVLGELVDLIAIRIRDDDDLAELCDHAGVPVVNMMSSSHHPCQALADLLTLRERFGSTHGLKVAFLGEGDSNVARSLMLLGGRAGCEVVVACPEDFSPTPELLRRNGARITDDPSVAITGAHAVYTDAWVCATDTPVQARHRRKVLAPYRVDEAMLASAREDAIVLHCMPAHPEDEIADAVLYGPQSAVRDQARNRIHAQKALLELLLSHEPGDR